MPKKIAVFIPVYNEEEKLAETLDMIPGQLNNHEVEIVIVDDGSSDESASIARKFTEHFIALPENCGVGMATKKGLEYIANRGGYEHVIKFDGDGQHNLDYLLKVEWELHNNDIVICSRFHALSDQTHTPIDRILLNMIFVEMLRKITGWELTDVRSGFMGFQFSDIEKIASQIIIPRYGIPMELLLRIWKIKPNAKIYEIPHPALYGDISKKLSEKYSKEKNHHQSDRLRTAYESLLMVVEDLQISKKQLLEMNGFLCSESD